MKCINCCEILMDLSVLPSLLQDREEKRIYIGSCFCERFFLNQKSFESYIPFCQKNQVKVTLVIPVFAQDRLESGKAAVDRILKAYGDRIDEITVNDLGMLVFCKEHYGGTGGYLLNLGRLFFKDARDFRESGLFSETKNVTLFDFAEEEIFQGISYWEIDNIYSKIEIPDKIKLAVHTPLTYMTTGNICKFASVDKALDQKFRPNAACNTECSEMLEIYEDLFDGESKRVFRIGRAVYYENPLPADGRLQADREIYFPFTELQKRMGRTL